jgi:serine/threonine protein kinase
VWNVGVIMLSIMSGRYPVFDRSDSEEALIQLAIVLGRPPVMGDTCVTFHHVPLDRAGEDESTHDDWPSLEEWCWLSSGKHWPKEAFELLRGLLTFDPMERWGADDGLKSGFVMKDYDERGAGWDERRKVAEENERVWKVRKERREERWKKKDKRKGGEKENVNGQPASSALSRSSWGQYHQSERSVFTSQAQLGEEGSNAVGMSRSSSSSVLRFSGLNRGMTWR